MLRKPTADADAAVAHRHRLLADLLVQVAADLHHARIELNDLLEDRHREAPKLWREAPGKQGLRVRGTEVLSQNGDGGSDLGFSPQHCDIEVGHILTSKLGIDHRNGPNNTVKSKWAKF